MKLTILLSLIVGLLVVPSFQQKLIWIDTDPGIDEGVLDDAIAIFVGGFNANVKIVGITVVAGNASPEKVEKNALNLLNFVKLDVRTIFLHYNPAFYNLFFIIQA